MRASKSFLEIVRLNYLIEQHILAIRAKKGGDMNRAIIHYENLVSASRSPGLYTFDKSRKYWTFSFPFAFPILEQVPPEVANREPKKVTEAMYRAMLADALEKAGRTEEAMSEYVNASYLLGYTEDVGRVKEFIREVMPSDDELLKLQDQYVHPENVR